MRIDVKGAIDVKDLVKKESHKRMRKAMFDSKPVIQQQLQAEVRSVFKVRKQSFPRGFKGWIAYKNTERLPIAVYKFVVPWSGAHAEDTTIRGRNAKGLMIPLNRSTRINPQRWREMIQRQVALGNLEFRKVGSKVIVFMEAIPEAASALGGFKKTRMKNGKRVKRIDIPVAIWVPQVRLRKRLDTNRMAERAVQSIAQAWEVVVIES